MKNNVSDVGNNSSEVLHSPGATQWFYLTNSLAIWLLFNKRGTLSVFWPRETEPIDLHSHSSKKTIRPHQELHVYVLLWHHQPVPRRIAPINHQPTPLWAVNKQAQLCTAKRQFTQDSMLHFSGTTADSNLLSSSLLPISKVPAQNELLIKSALTFWHHLLPNLNGYTEAKEIICFSPLSNSVLQKYITMTWHESINTLWKTFHCT